MIYRKPDNGVIGFLKTKVHAYPLDGTVNVRDGLHNFIMWPLFKLRKNPNPIHAKMTFPGDAVKVWIVFFQFIQLPYIAFWQKQIIFRRGMMIVCVI